MNCHSRINVVHNLLYYLVFYRWQHLINEEFYLPGRNLYRVQAWSLVFVDWSENVSYTQLHTSILPIGLTVVLS